MSLTVVELEQWGERRIWQVRDNAGPWRSGTFYATQGDPDFFKGINERVMDYLYWRHGDRGWRKVWEKHGDQLVNEMHVIARASADRPTVDSETAG